MIKARFRVEKPPEIQRPASDVRRNVQCPRCKNYTATYFCRASESEAMMMCNNVKGKLACGHRFTVPHPTPLTALSVVDGGEPQSEREAA